MEGDVVVGNGMQPTSHPVFTRQTSVSVFDSQTGNDLMTSYPAKQPSDPGSGIKIKILPLPIPVALPVQV